MSAAVILLDFTDPAIDVREIAGEVTIEALQRAHMAAEAVLEPPRQSTLIAMLARASREDREAIIAQLQRRKP